MALPGATVSQHQNLYGRGHYFGLSYPHNVHYLSEFLLRFNLNVCDSHKFLKRNLNFNFYLKLKRTPLQIGSRQKSAHWYVETAYITRRQKTCLFSSYLVIESSRKHYVIS